MRQWHVRLAKNSKDQIAEKLASQQAQIIDLEDTVNVLTTAHVALIAAVAQLGGMGKLAKFYSDFQDLRNQLSDLGAFPEKSPNFPSTTGGKN